MGVGNGSGQKGLRESQGRSGSHGSQRGKEREREKERGRAEEPEVLDLCARERG